MEKRFRRFSGFWKTYYLHKPLLNMIKFGIDATWFDISYAKYSEPMRMQMMEPTRLWRLWRL